MEIMAWKSMTQEIFLLWKLTTVAEVLPATSIGNSFNVSLPIEDQAHVQHKSMEASLDPLPEDETSYEIVSGGAKMGGDLFICPNPYTYSRYSHKRPQSWRCSQKGSIKCKTIVHGSLGKLLYTYLISFS